MIELGTLCLLNCTLVSLERQFVWTDTYLYYIKSYNINTNVFHIEFNVSLPVQNIHYKSLLKNGNISGFRCSTYVLLFSLFSGK